MQTGELAVTRLRVNLRSSAGFGRNWIRTLPRGTRLEIIGGPVCTEYLFGPYLWWEVQLEDGQTGWTAETAVWRSYYFLEPAE